MALDGARSAPLRDDLETVAGQSFDCEDNVSQRQQATRKSCAIKVGLSITLSLGIVLALALIGTPGVIEPEMLRKFGIAVSPSRARASAQANQHPMPNVPAASQGSQPLVPSINAGSAIPAGSTDASKIVSPVPVSPPSRTSAPTMLTGSQEQVLMLFSIMGFGKILQGRFPGKDANVIQKLLLQFIVPATLFKGLSSQTVAMSQLSFIGAGAGMVLARYICAWFATSTVLGNSKDPNQASLKRTGLFQISTMASALSVLPFVGEFVGASYVGLGGLVDLPMKLYMLIIMPVLLKLKGEASDSSSSSGGGPMATIQKLLSDPISLSLILGLATSAATGGQGLAAMGFFGKAINTLAGAQTAVLFLLIGLKLKLDSDSPLISLVLLLVTQGALLIIASALCMSFPLSDAMKQFILLFAQGSPSVVGLGVITAAASSGVKGYNTDFGFDICALAFPLSAMLQCLAGVMGPAYAPFAGVFGVGLIGIAGVLRVVYKSKFVGGAEPSPA